MKNLSKSLLFISLFCIVQIFANGKPNLEVIIKPEETCKQKVVNIFKNNKKIQKIAQFAKDHKKKLIGTGIFLAGTIYGLSALNETSYEVVPNTKVHNWLHNSGIYTEKHYVKNSPIYKKIFPASQLACLRRILIYGFKFNKNSTIIDILNEWIMFFIADLKALPFWGTEKNET